MASRRPLFFSALALALTLLNCAVSPVAAARSLRWNGYGRSSVTVVSVPQAYPAQVVAVPSQPFVTAPVVVRSNPVFYPPVYGGGYGCGGVGVGVGGGVGCGGGFVGGGVYPTYPYYGRR